MSKFVLFTQRVEIIESYNERRDCADQRVAKFIHACGYIPVPVPNDKRIAEHMMSDLIPTGVILTGGNSLVKYGGNAPERDETDRVLIELAIKEGIPLIGFCRGMQSIIDYCGDNLISITGHVAVRHIIKGIEEVIEVNSYHNQGCMEVNSDVLEVVMKSEDGVVEKVRHKYYPIIGIMWHPERETVFNKRDISLVQSLFGGENI